MEGHRSLPDRVRAQLERETENPVTLCQREELQGFHNCAGVSTRTHLSSHCSQKSNLIFCLIIQ